MHNLGLNKLWKPAKFGCEVIDPAGWSAEHISERNDWIYHFSQSDIGELKNAIRTYDKPGLNLLSLNRSGFHMPNLEQRLAEIRDEILFGRGFAVFRGFPVEEIGKVGSAIAFWAIGQFLGDGVLSQNKHGHALGHVTDLGESRENHSQRGPYSREEIPFHVDCCDIVGLLCLQTPLRGGESSLTSSVAVHNEMLRCWPELTEILFQPFYRDRRDEIPSGMKPWYQLAVFHIYEGYFSASVEPTYIGSAHRFDEVPDMTALQKEALETVQNLSRDLRFDTGFKKGDMQFCNNHVIFHTRLAYEDHSEAGFKRHLLRLWLKNLDGRPLPPDFYKRHGEIGKIDRPGGILVNDTVINAPI